jgi:hypothetical protein
MKYFAILFMINFLLPSRAEAYFNGGVILFILESIIIGFTITIFFIKKILKKTDKAEKTSEVNNDDND